MRPQSSALRLALLVFAGLVLHTDRLALAQDEDPHKEQRESLKREIHTDLENLSSHISDVAGAGSADGLHRAIGTAGSMQSKVDKLEDIQGADDAAKAIAARYPDYLGSFLRASNALVKLKTAQLAQDQRALGQSCAEEAKSLRDAMKPLLEPPDPGGVEKIPQLAEAAKGRIHDDYARQVGQESEIAGAYNEARSFSSSDGGWSSVSSRLRDGCEGTWTRYQAALKSTKENCAELARGKDQAAVVEAVARLTSAGGESRKLMDEILRDWGAWKELRRDLAAQYVVNADKVRLAICDGDEEQIVSRVEAAELSAQGNLKGGYETLDKELDQLIERAGKLENDGAVGADARKWRGVMRGAKTRLAKVLQDGGILQGVQNAKVRARLQVGIDNHARLQTGCTANEYQIPGGRIDCLNISDGSCEVIEIKPNNEKARAKGRDQLAGYKSTIERMKTDNNLTELLQRCVKDGQLNVTYEVEVYEFCPVPDEDLDAMLGEQVKQSASTADE
jgi:hypothetical protein